jgi:hypothetical protein
MWIRKKIQVIKHENVTIGGAQYGKKSYTKLPADMWHSVAFLWPKMKQYYFIYISKLPFILSAIH